MKKFLFSVLIIISACKSNQNYNLNLRPWIGQSQSSLVSQWGEPDNIFGIDSNTYVYVYEKISNSPFDADRHPYDDELNYQAASGSEYGISQMPKVYYCKTTFTIRNNQVVDYAFNGDDCV
ncbi:MAG: hypothetical protein IJF12_04165 [Alphaproteobacteria bacterium]|nr:hypothetical protein [Alphaproteobacteria bacterium]